MTYLDHNATSPLRPEAKAAMERALAVTGNPSSVHAAGRAARALVEEARERLASNLSVRAQDLVFTSGATEANALALWGAIHGAADANARITRLFVSAIEHESVLQNAAAIAERQAGTRLTLIPVTPRGQIDVDALSGLLREGKGRALIAVMAVNNETGVIQPLQDVAKLAREYGALLLVDAVQALGKIAFDGALADYVSLSSHKIGGPTGVGALWIRDGAPFSPQILGGGQERGRRAGTENVIGIAGFGGCVVATGTTTVRDRFEGALKNVDGVVIFGNDAPRVSNTSCFALEGIAAETAVMALDLDGICVSSGSACSSGKVRPSYVLGAMGVTEELASCALRASFGWNSVEADADVAVAAIERLVARTRARRAA